MGLDAYVACSCYRDGLTSEPPVPRDQLMIDECGDVVPIDEDACDDHFWDVFHPWQDTACRHERMQFVGEWIGNVMGIAWLRSVTANLDEERFPVLAPVLTGLSGLMDSHLPAVVARRALSELVALLEENSPLGTTRMVCGFGGAIVDDAIDRGSVDYTTFRSLGPWVVRTPELADIVDVGLEGWDFVVKTHEGDSELLRARLLGQVWHEETVDRTTEGAQPTALVTFSDVMSGETIHVRSFGLSVREPWPDEATSAKPNRGDDFWRRYPPRLFVSERKIVLGEIWWELDTLKRLFEASADSGNPVVWC